MSTSVSLIIFSASSSANFSSTFFFTWRRICARVQLCSTAHSSRSDSSLARSSSRSVPAVVRQSSAPAGRSSPPVGGHLLRYHVCLRTGVLECLDDASLHMTSHCVVGVGPPTASRCNGPSVPWVSLPGPTWVPPMPKQDGIRSRAPTLVVTLCWWWWTWHVDVAHTRVLQAHFVNTSNLSVSKCFLFHD